MNSVKILCQICESDKIVVINPNPPGVTSGPILQPIIKCRACGHEYPTQWDDEK